MFHTAPELAASQTRSHCYGHSVLILLLFISLFIAYTPSVFAAVAVDSTSSANSNAPTTLSASHTINGANRLLLVGVSIWNNDQGNDYVSNVSYGGTNLVLVGTHRRSNNSRVEIWALKAPTVGTANILVTFNQQIANGAGFGAISFTGVDQTTPYGSMASSDAQSSTASLTMSSASNELAFIVLAAKDQNGLPTAGAGINNTWNYKWTGNNRLVGAGGTVNGASSITASWTLNRNRDWAMAGISIKPAIAPSACITYRDEFTTESYSRQDGTANWSGNWLEIGDNNNASNGDIEIFNGELQLEGDGNSPSIEREANLLNYNQVTLSFNYRTSGNWEANDRTYIYVSSNGGSNWTLLNTFTNDQAASVYSQDISTYAASNFRLRFVEGANQASEIFHFDNVQVLACDTAPPTITAVAAVCPGLNQITVTFSEDVDSATATNVSNYALNNGISVTGATLTSSNVVTLDTSTLTDLTSYTLTVNNVQDLAGNTITANTTAALSVNCSVVTSCVTFRDEFTIDPSERYDRQDGTANWSGNWIETGDNNNPATGNIEIAPYNGQDQLQLEGDGNSPSIARGADLSSYNSATLTFNYQTSGNWEPSDTASVYVSNNGGTSWTLLNTFANDQAANTYSADITGYIASNFMLRFVEGANRANELFHIDNVQVEACSTSLIHHFEIVHDGTALTCEPEQVTVKACATADCSTLYTASTVSATLTPTGWVTSDTQTITTGSITPQLSINTAGTYTLGVNTSSPLATNPVVCTNTATMASGDAASGACDVQFYDSGFTYSIPTQVACETSTTPITIRAVGTDPATQQCVALFSGPVTKTINFTVSPAPTPDVIMNQGAANQATFTAATPSQPVALSFNNSEATFTLTHNNAGQFTLSSAFTEGSLNMAGSGTFVVRPHSFYLQAYYDNAGSEVDLNNATASGDPKWKASDNFRLRLRGQCQDGTVTTNYTPTNAELQVELALPAGGNNNNLTIQTTNNYPSTASASPMWYNISALFNNGAVTDGVNDYANAAFHEVGVLNLHLRDNNYLGSSIAEQTFTVGRFTPHHFDTVVTHGCSGGANFTYSGQPFIVAVNAMNNQPTPVTTLNYTGNFAKDTTISDAGTTSNFSNNVIPASNFTNGIAQTDLVTGPSPIRYTFTVKDTAPTTITLRAQDADIPASTGINEATTEIRSGRTYLENAFGSELQDLQVPAWVQYFDGSDYVVSNSDSCTALTAVLTDIGTDPVTVGNGSASGQTCIWDDDAESGANNCSAAVPGPVTSQFEEPPVNGSFNLFLKAPGQNNTGDIGVTLNSPSWLQYDWDNDGNPDNDPNGVASFGLYRGDDRVIYWREVFQ